MIHCSLWAFICVVACIFILILVYPSDVATRCSRNRLPFVCVVGRCWPIEPALAHISTSSLWSYLQCHIIEVLCELRLGSHYYDVVICVYVSLKSIASIITLVVLRIVAAVVLLLLSWLCLIYGITKETFIWTIQSSVLRLHERILKSVAQVNAWLTNELSWMEMLRDLVIQIQIRMLLSIKHFIWSRAIWVAREVTFWLLMRSCNW